MKKSLIILCVLTLLGQISHAQNTKARLLADWERGKKFMTEYLAAMPEDGYSFKPTPEIRSYSQQMMHVADANFAFASAASGKASPYQGSAEKASDHSKATVTKTVMQSIDFTIEALKGISDADFEKKVKVFGQELTVESTLSKSFEHMCHHRGQTTIYLRLKGIKPPAEGLF
jgi:uncharacterized damage-inducible protein DinB